MYWGDEAPKEGTEYARSKKRRLIKEPRRIRSYNKL